ncbi:T9SS type A sorting domain-containing protein [Polaribacter porphyrae]|uniref:Secretion system C-terminal sorting domain-containing protein n=1 Tax=Polaribacter porphyrae TaxID=1137780 RepID=A0A2S7WPN5_9FLAO|nr:T9SS type A sorting domain-containing protein [Polaribacter porphyrae]PQJ79567.1 hypothetical protein BTO18_10465 [Polaribacter porphyrae]
MKKQLVFIFFLISALGTFSQKATLSSGEEATGNGSVSYSVGQVFYTTNSSSNGSSLEGIQQSVELFVLSNSDFKDLVLKAVVYPNPIQNSINLILENTSLKQLKYHLYDIKGIAIKKGSINLKKTTIDISKYSTGIYLLKVIGKDKPLKTFKILKK